ncbi:MAG TPA: diaminopimelate epimerase [Candidatus Binataceae bacterium]|nr:diaminopimelate epimerase [Candidatus Binataceae bacterium]
MPELDFVKMQGCGNDYIYVVADRVRPANPGELARRVSARRFGIGGDGLILLCPSRTADVRMEMYNADGSRGEMCGNGIRCVARLQYGIEGGRRNPIVVDTDCGLKTISLRVEDLRPLAATVDMGEPILEGREIPVKANGRVVAYPLKIGGVEYKITAVSMGNPHCVVFVEDESVFDLDDVAFAQLGLRFENDAFFPRRVNTEFILPIGRDHLKMRVWERGSGETLACGTGACAALVAAVLNDHSGRRATVELRGGNLEIEWRERGDGANHVYMTGDAVEVFRGTITVSDDELIAV